MDGRFSPVAIDCKKDYRVYLHPTAEMEDIRSGSATDAFDLSPFMSEGSQSFFEAQVTLRWGNELWGANQPQVNQILEIRTGGNIAWLGIIGSISSFRLTRGERSMQISAKSRDSLNLWRQTKLVTNAYPILTDLAAIGRDIATKIGLYDDEIMIPSGLVTTAHSTNQMAGMSAWDMFTTLFLPMGLTPFVDCLGRLRGASRDLNNRASDIVLTADRIVSVDASRNQAPTSRVRVKWLDPKLTKSIQTGRKLAEATMTTGWFLPYLQKEVGFSDDRTQRAENTYMKIIHSANSIGIPVCDEMYEANSATSGEIRLLNFAWVPLLITLLYTHNIVQSTEGDPVLTGGVLVSGGITIPAAGGSAVAANIRLAIDLTMMSVGTGVYEIWGNPYDWVHARNTTEAFDQYSPGWVDDPEDVESDLVFNEAHAQVISVRELIYRYNQGNNWSLTLVEDQRIEFGDILEFPDATRMYVLDATREIGRDSQATVQVKGFLLGTPNATTPVVSAGSFEMAGVVTQDGNPLGGVSIIVTGLVNLTVTTGGSGAYFFAGLQNGNYVVTPSLAGYDFVPSTAAITIAGGNVTQDFLASNNPGGTHVISGTISGTPGYVVVTVTGGSSMTTVSDGAGNYEFSGLPDNATYVVTPSLYGYTFSPASLTVTLSGDSADNQNLTGSVASVSSGGTAPTQAAVAGFTTLNFFDDFATFDTSVWFPGIWYEPTYGAGQSWNTASSVLDLKITPTRWNNGGNDADTSILTASRDFTTVRAWKYGYFEARMRWDVTNGAWPAFWLNGDYGSGSAPWMELDIFEGQGDDNQAYFGTLHTWPTHTQSSPNRFPVSTDFSQWHTYGALWTPGNVKFYLDNVFIASVNTPSVGDTGPNLYMILSMQMGNDWSEGNTSGVSASEMNNYVDWVKVWK